MKRALSMYFRLIYAQIRSQFQYRASFWIDFFSSGILSGVFFAGTALVISQFKTIGGWNLGEIALLTGMIETGFGLMDLVFSGFDPDWFATMVQMGKLDQLLVRPLSLELQLLGGRFVVRRLGRVFEGLVILAIGLGMTNIHWTAAKVIYFPIVILSQMVMMGALFIIGSTLTFWTIQRIEAVNILTYGGVEMTSYPMHIYPVSLRRFFTYIIPFIFINYYPALYFLDKPDPLGYPVFAPFLAPAAAGLFLWAALRFWKFGVAHYQSTGT